VAPTAAQAAQSAGNEVRVSRAARAWAIDGVPSEVTLWYPVNYLVFGAENYTGPADLSGQVGFAWDSQAFYVATVVTDEVVSQSSRGANLYLGDSIEIQWDVDLAGDRGNNEFDGDDWHIGLSPGNFNEAGAEAYVWAPRAVSGADAGIKTASQPVVMGGQTKGYVIETAIPWHLLGVTPRAGDTFGFAFSISDNDTLNPVQQSMLSTAPNRQWHRPQTFHTLSLQP